jgi:microcystin-dependent protein
VGEPFLSQIEIFSFNFAPRGWAQCNGQLLPINQNQALFALLGTTYGGNGQTTFALPDLRNRVPIGFGQGPGLSPFLLGERGGSDAITLTLTQLPSHTHVVTPGTLTQRGRLSQGDQRSAAGGTHAVESDEPASVGVTVIRAAHILESRRRADLLRAQYGLGGFAYTDATLTAGLSTIKAAHVLDLRQALQEARTAGGLTPLAFTDPALAAGDMVKAVHIDELRSVVPATTATYSTAAADATLQSGAVALSGSLTAAPVGGSQAHNNVMPYLSLNFCIALQGIFPSQT